MRVVLDTNIILSGLFFGGGPRAILDLIEKEEIVPCFTPTTFGELHDVLTRDRFKSVRDVLPFTLDEYLTRLGGYSLLFPQSAALPAVIKEDSADNAFLACAIAAHASYIVSGDKHLLNLKNFSGIPIVTPAKFLSQKRKK